MNDVISSMVIGFLLASSSFWLIAFINDSYTHREEKLARLLLKRAKMDYWLGKKPICGVALQFLRLHKLDLYFSKTNKAVKGEGLGVRAPQGVLAANLREGFFE